MSTIFVVSFVELKHQYGWKALISKSLLTVYVNKLNNTDIIDSFESYNCQRG